jgi:Fe2+ or Zn2+ uptake regulation protein
MSNSGFAGGGDVGILTLLMVNPVIQQTIGRCREHGLRRTKALEELIATLLEAGRPMTLGELAASKRLAEQCDKATVVRLLQRLAGHGIVRRLGLHERAAYFTLLVPGRHSDYLICTSCGSIKAVEAPCPVHELEEEIRKTTGFRNLYHELEFFGLCPECAGDGADDSGGGCACCS